MPFLALADTETVDGITWTYTVRDGKARVEVDGSSAIPSSTTGSITIPSMLGGCPVTSVGNYAFHGCNGLMSVMIPSSVTRIGRYAFSGCSGLKSVTIPSSVIRIGANAFFGCSSLSVVCVDGGDVKQMSSLLKAASVNCDTVKVVELVSPADSDVEPVVTNAIPIGKPRSGL